MSPLWLANLLKYSHLYYTISLDPFNIILVILAKICDIFPMASGATSNLWGFITSSEFKLVNDSLPLLKFRLAFSRYDFQSKSNVTEFIPVTAFSKIAERLNNAIASGMNYICCHCDIKVASFTSKSGSMLQQQEHIINDFRIFSKPKTDAKLPAAAENVQSHPTTLLHHSVSHLSAAPHTTYASATTSRNTTHNLPALHTPITANSTSSSGNGEDVSFDQELPY
jgi:single-stranded DNA-binding protein